MPLHDYIPVLEDGEETREGLIRKYFNLGFPCNEILVFLSKFHGIIHLKRLLKTMGLRRRYEGSPMNEVVSAIERVLRGSGSSIGYIYIYIYIYDNAVGSQSCYKQRDSPPDLKDCRP